MKASFYDHNAKVPPEAIFVKLLMIILRSLFEWGALAKKNLNLKSPNHFRNKAPPHK
jgi:hypothetical protein